MKMPLNRIVFILTFIFCAQSFAQNQNVDNFRANEKSLKNFLSVGTELSQFASENGSLQGFGISLRYLHAFHEDWGIAAAISQHMSAGGASPAGVLYTGFAGQIQYAITGRMDQKQNSLYYEGKELVRHRRGQRNAWLVGLGLEQLFLNGENDVFPATGLSLMTSYRTELWGFQLRPELAFGQLTANGTEALSMIRATLFISFPL